jgi:hypothetical protein
MTRYSRHELDQDIANAVSDDLWPILENDACRLVDVLKKTGHDFSKSRASQILRMIESTNSPSRE